MEFDREMSGFAGFSFGLVVVVLLAFAILQWLHVPTGDFLDWVIGTASFWWLAVVLTVPWNVRFGAQAVLADAAVSREKGMEVDEAQLAYVATLARRSLWIALALHLASAVGLYLLAATGVSAIGYVSSAAALLLTGLRPAIAAYQYLARRLRNIGKALRYPREDVVELRSRLDALEAQQKELLERLDVGDRDSWAARQEQSVETLQKECARLAAAQRELAADNEAAHQRLSQETRSAIAQLNADSEFLDRVREIVRFFKSA